MQMMFLKGADLENEVEVLENEVKVKNLSTLRHVP